MRSIWDGKRKSIGNVDQPLQRLNLHRLEEPLVLRSLEPPGVEVQAVGRAECRSSEQRCFEGLPAQQGMGDAGCHRIAAADRILHTDLGRPCTKVEFSVVTLNPFAAPRDDDPV